MLLLTTWIEDINPMNQIILDSGASCHMFNSQSFFSQLNELSGDDFINTGSKDAKLPIKGNGTVNLTWKGSSVSLSNCLFVPDLVVNLISPGELISNKKCSLSSFKNWFSLFADSQLAFTGFIHDNLFVLNPPSRIGNNNKFCHLTFNNLNHYQIDSLHQSFGHASPYQLKNLFPTLSAQTLSSFQCKDCVFSKISKSPFKITSSPTSRPLKQLHIDLIGLINPPSQNNMNYIMTVVNNFSGYISAIPLSHKSDACLQLKVILNHEKQKQNRFPATICTDGGGEFSSSELKDLFKINSIQHLIS